MKINIISIEGNIGSGKSTVIDALKTHYKESDNIYFLQEPVNEWTSIKDDTGKNIIEKFYENIPKYSFSFQIMAYITRLVMLKNAIKKCSSKRKRTNTTIICERSLQTDKNVFCKMLYDSNDIEEINYQIYLRWFNEFIKDIPPIQYIYIKTDPNIAYERVIKRDRKGENISLEYLKMCDKYHNDWLSDISIIINGNESALVTFAKINKLVLYSIN